MASTRGRKDSPLSRNLGDEPYRFDFFQAVRLLERMAQWPGGQTDRGEPGPVGQDGPPDQEMVRFRALASHSFPPAGVASLSDWAGDGLNERQNRPPEMVVSFMGLTGPSGVLPDHYTSLLIERIRNKDFALRDFLDLFNHRAISLFYRAWQKYRFPLAYEQVRLRGSGSQEDVFTRCLYSLVGMGTEGLRGQSEFDDEVFLYYAGYFSHFPRAAVSLEMLLVDYYGMPVEVRQFQGQWLRLSEEDRSVMPRRQMPEGRNSQVGQGLVIGERIWDVEGKLRIRIGPLNYQEFRRFMPSGCELKPICQLIRSYVGVQFDFDVQTVLRADEIPRCRLGGDRSDPSCLGWNTWIRSREFKNDVDDAIFSVGG